MGRKESNNQTKTYYTAPWMPIGWKCKMLLFRNFTPKIKFSKYQKHEMSLRNAFTTCNNHFKVRKGAKIRDRYNQVPHLSQDTNGKVTNSQLDTTNESQEVSPFTAGDHKAHINRRARRHSKHKTEKHKRSTKEVPPWNGQ